MTDWDADTPGSVLRELVAEAVGAEGTEGEEQAEGEDEAVPFGLVERGDDPDPAARLPALIAAGDSVVGVVPRADAALARRLLGDGTESIGGGVRDAPVRLVFTGRAADRLAGPTGAATRSVLADRGVDAYRHDGDSPIGVLLVGDRAVVGLFDEAGLAALLWSDEPAVREWAAATCRRYLSAAEPV